VWPRTLRSHSLLPASGVPFTWVRSSMPSPCFLPPAHAPGTPLSSTRSSGIECPCVDRYYEGAKTSCQPSRRTSFPSFGRLPEMPPVFIPEHPGCPSVRPGIFGSRPATLRLLIPWSRQDLPSSCETPMTCLLMLQRLRREPLVTRLTATGDTAPHRGTQRASALGLSKLNNMASRLAVYASQLGSPRDHARLASRCWLGSPGWVHSTGSLRRFQLLIPFASSFPGYLARSPLFATPVLERGSRQESRSRRPPRNHVSRPYWPTGNLLTQTAGPYAPRISFFFEPSRKPGMGGSGAVSLGVREKQVGTPTIEPLVAELKDRRPCARP